jgi:hypothetical protein
VWGHDIYISVPTINETSHLVKPNGDINRQQESPVAITKWALEIKVDMKATDHWLERTSKRHKQFLTGIREQLKTAWRRDKNGSDGYPMNTAYLIGEVKSELHGRRSRRIRRLPAPKTLKRLSDILDDKLVQDVYEYLHEEPLKYAFARLSTSAEEVALKQISEAVSVALEVSRFGEHALPKPRGNWLHRQLLGLAAAAKLGDLTNREMAEFFNDLCPCGAKHNRETIKKFRQRRGARDA